MRLNRVPWVDPKTHEPLQLVGEYLRDGKYNIVAEVVQGIPRFVPMNNYADSFGWQWNRWENERSSSRGSDLNLREIVLKRTQFERFDLQGKLVLECGMGGGDDTEILLTLPFSEVHSFDLSNSVDRANKYIKDDRLFLSQASIYGIPYPDQSFDVVYCHRVLQHTPDPVKSLKSICAKVKPGGILFAHAYKRSWRYMMEWRYKYRWLTKRLPKRWIYFFVDKLGAFLHDVNSLCYRFRVSRFFAYNFIPFYHSQKKGFSRERLIELEKLITFDALTPYHDHPMSSEEFFGTIEKEGFEIVNKRDPRLSPMWCTAIRKE